jgi:hypothetical protein
VGWAVQMPDVTPGFSLRPSPLDFIQQVPPASEKCVHLAGLVRAAHNAQHASTDGALVDV